MLQRRQSHFVFYRLTCCTLFVPHLESSEKPIQLHFSGRQYHWAGPPETVHDHHRTWCHWPDHKDMENLRTFPTSDGYKQVKVSTKHKITSSLLFSAFPCPDGPPTWNQGINTYCLRVFSARQPTQNSKVQYRTRVMPIVHDKASNLRCILLKDTYTFCFQ